jgi:deoxyribose-phosphate aldolase
MIYSNGNLESLIEQITDVVLSKINASDDCGCADEWLAKCGGFAQIVDAGASRVGLVLGESGTSRDWASFIDHTLLKPEAAEADIRRLCEEAAEYKFASVCVNPFWIKTCAEILRNSGVPVCTVIGFPLGANTTDTKVFETRRAIFDGAREVDMVINVGALKSGDHCTVEKDIREVAQAAHEFGAICKVIIETALLTDEEKVRASLAAKHAGADFVKTSTGFSKGGATVEDIMLMRRTVGADLGVKASGGVKSLADARAMIQAGATRIGASVGVKIAQEADNIKPSAVASNY